MAVVVVVAAAAAAADVITEATMTTHNSSNSSNSHHMAKHRVCLKRKEVHHRKETRAPLTRTPRMVATRTISPCGMHPSHNSNKEVQVGNLPQGLLKRGQIVG